MNAPFEQLIQHFNKHELKYQEHPEAQALFAMFGCDCGPCGIVVQVAPEDDLFQVFGRAPVRVPEGSRPAIAETVARANYGMKVGKFELDFSDGELRFQTYHILENGDLPEEVIGRLIATTLAMMDRYVPAVLSVIYGNELPEDAIRRAEADV